MSLTKKTVILFDPEQYKKLKIKAKLQGTSVGALIREAVDKMLMEKDKVSRKERIEAAQRIISGQEEVIEWQKLEELITRGHIEW